MFWPSQRFSERITNGINLCSKRLKQSFLFFYLKRCFTLLLLVLPLQHQTHPYCYNIVTILLLDKLTRVVNVGMFCRDNNGRFSAGMYHMLLNKANLPSHKNNFRHRNQVPSYLICLKETVFLNFFFKVVF